MNDLSIKVFPRKERGRQNNKIRQKKEVPAVVYGNGQKNLSFSLDIRLAEKYSKKEFENKIFTFQSEDKNLEGLKVIKKEVSRHKLTHRPIHMDFLSLDMSKAIRVQVDLKFKGTPKGVKEEGGVFNIILRQIELECLPSEIPPFIELDVSNLALNQSQHVSDLKVSANTKLITRAKRTICTVVSSAEEEVAKPEESKIDEKEKSDKPAEAAKSCKTRKTRKTRKKIIFCRAWIL